MTESRLLAFIQAMTRRIEAGPNDEASILPQATGLLRELVAVDDWLPPEMARPDPQFYQQHLLYGDPLDRFSLVSFVWGPGQKTPIHDHTVWGVIGMLRGGEYAQPYRKQGDAYVAHGAESLLRPGDVEAVSPTIGDIHQVRNASDSEVSISIHLYGGNIGRIRRSVYAVDGTVKPFVSGYSNKLAPNLWKRD
ncbi:MAG: Cysteine dioxygenase [Paucimonas sp.]|nr:Cysteine dioxygenase [Paucimonas sp.]